MCETLINKLIQRKTEHVVITRLKNIHWYDITKNISLIDMCRHKPRESDLYNYIKKNNYQNIIVDFDVIENDIKENFNTITSGLYKIIAALKNDGIVKLFLMVINNSESCYMTNSTTRLIADNIAIKNRNKLKLKINNHKRTIRLNITKED